MVASEDVVSTYRGVKKGALTSQIRYRTNIDFSNIVFFKVAW